MTTRTQCHCGSIELTLAEMPDYPGTCNSSICLHYHALWGYYSPETASPESGKSALDFRMLDPTLYANVPIKIKDGVSCNDYPEP